MSTPIRAGMSDAGSVAVTGADGFIGRHLVHELLDNGYEVYAIVRDGMRARAVLGEHARLRWIKCPMDRYGELVKHGELRSARTLFHFAWAGVSGPDSADYAVQLNNVRRSCDLLSAAKELGVRRLVFADSIMEFEHMKAFSQGNYRVSLRNTYHVSKIAARHLLQLRAANAQMEFIPAVISNVYGAGENSPRLINTVVRALLDGRHMPLTAGEQLYDFIYITDAAKAIRLAAERGRSDKLYYIGNRSQRPLREYLCALRDVVAPGAQLGLGELPFQGVSLDYSELDTQGLYEDCSFEPEIPFEEGVRLLKEFIQNENRGGVTRRRLRARRRPARPDKERAA